MKLLVLKEQPGHVCYRYRVQAFEPELASRGIEVQAEPLAKRLLPRLRQFRRAKHFDAVLLQRRLLPLWQTRLLRRHAARLIFDFDDAVFLRDSFHPKGTYSRGRLLRFWGMVYSADAILAGNPFLEATAAQYANPRTTQIIPTCVNHTLYPQATHHRGAEDTRLVWIGGTSTLPSVRAIHNHLATATRQVPGLSLHVICDTFPQLAGVNVVTHPWAEATEARDVAAADIGISYLPDDDWSRGKCGLKVLQYMAAGLPVVANPVGENLRMVRDGETGLLASTPAEWAEALERLAHDPALRRHLGEAGRQRVIADYSVQRWAGTFADAVTGQAGHTVPPPKSGAFTASPDRTIARSTRS